MISFLQVRLFLLLVLPLYLLLLAVECIQHRSFAVGLLHTIGWILAALYLLKFLLYTLLNLRRMPALANPAEDPVDQWDQEARLGFVYASGTGSSPVQAAKFSRSFHYEPTAEKLRSPGIAVPLMNRHIYAAEGSEIMLVHWLNPLQLFPVPWFLWTYWKVWQRGIHRETCRYWTRSVMEYTLNPLGLDLGLEEDARRVYGEFTRACAEREQVVLFGFSKGCSALIHALDRMIATGNSSSGGWKKVKGVVLVAPFAHLGRLRTVPGSYLRKALLGMASLFLGLDTESNNPFAVLQKRMHQDQMPPVLVVASEADEIVDYDQHGKRYGELFPKSEERYRGELVTLQWSSHDGYQFDDSRDTSLLVGAVHGFYQKIGVPHLTGEQLYAQLPTGRNGSSFDLESGGGGIIGGKQ